MKIRILLFLSLLALVLGSACVSVPPARVAAVTWPTLHLQLITGGTPGVVSMANAGDGSGRLFIVQQSGQVRILQNGALQPAPFLDISGLVSCCVERGLLGLAFPPNYAARGHFYVYYTNTAGDIVIARYSPSANPNLADPASAVIVLTVPHPTHANHNGGQLAFGPDGYLYAGIGDGGGGGDPNGNGQKLSTLLGKLLRIDVEGPGCVQSPPKAQNYCIPPANPFVAAPGARAEIWAYGLRNPWRFSFDRLSGDLYIADVGQNIQEEIDFQATGAPGGQNYGWNVREGNLCYNPSSGCSDPPSYAAPVATYDHVSGQCSVTGGYVYRGPDIFLNMRGIYFYADFCAGKIYGLVNSGGWQSQPLATAPFLISTWGEDESGYLYIADFTNGAVYRLQGDLDPSVLSFRASLPLVAR